jgi:hypothetical protein
MRRQVQWHSRTSEAFFKRIQWRPAKPIFLLLLSRFLDTFFMHSRCIRGIVLARFSREHPYEV